MRRLARHKGMRAVPLSSFIVVAAVTVAAPAFADERFHALPGKGDLQLRVVEYDGAVHGALTVEIRNRGDRAERFTAKGLYFVPDGDPDAAPQRLGAVGPLVIDGAQKDKIEVPARGKVEVTLEVFCVDDHREAPTSETPFTVARHRMPADLATRIDERAAKPAAKARLDEAQSDVWEERDAKWMPLDGDGAQEKQKTEPHRVRDVDRIKEPMRDEEQLAP
jgi:hypothetical protein